MLSAGLTATLFAGAVLSSTVAAFTIKDELKAINRDNLAPYAALHGMNLTTVRVETSDGWVLQIHRIQNAAIYDPKFSSPVLLSHGFGCSSFDYMANPRNESIAFLLADRGYDVWAVNYRGNQFSNKVIKDGLEKKPPNEYFYRATWQYMGQKDLPAIVNKILKVTGHSKVYMVGQSMGTTTVFSFLSENHDYDDKIGHFAAIVPVTKFGDDTDITLKVPFIAARPIPGLVWKTFYPTVFGRDLADVPDFISKIKTGVCIIVPGLCRLLTAMLFDPNKLLAAKDLHVQKDRLPIYIKLFPSGLALMNMYQFARQYEKDPWEKMDYREVKQTGITNEQEYNQSTPPKYDFTNVNVSLSLDYSNADIFTGVKTAQSVIDELGLSSKDARIHNCRKLDHHESLWGWDARCCMYDSILERFEQKELSRGQDFVEYRGRVENYVHEVLKDFNEECIKLRADPKYDQWLLQQQR